MEKTASSRPETGDGTMPFVLAEWMVGAGDPIYIFTYSKSTGFWCIPVDGGATHPAILPGSVTPTMSDLTCSRSSSVGSQ